MGSEGGMVEVMRADREVENRGEKISPSALLMWLPKGNEDQLYVEE